MVYNQINMTNPNWSVPTNQRPQFTAPFDLTACLGQTKTLVLTGTDGNGDSLSYALTQPLNGSFAGPAAFVAPYSWDNPMPGLSLDSLTGLVTLNPTMLGTFVFAVEVTEYDSTGTWISKYIRDVQVVVEACTNQLPYDSLGLVASVQGGIKTGDYGIDMCQGADFSMSANYSDPDTTQLLTLSTNVEQVIPGASAIITDGNPASIQVEISETFLVPGAYHFTVTEFDQHCPVQGTQNYLYTLTVNPAAYVSGATGVCAGDTAILTGYGGVSWQWTSIGGDTIQPNVNFGCLDNLCSQVWVAPDSATTYVIDIFNSTLGCSTADSLMVEVGEDFSLNMHTVAAPDCSAPAATFAAEPNLSGNYTYQWSGPNIQQLSSPTDSLTEAQFAEDGPQMAYVAVENESGCLKQDSVQVDVHAFSFIFPLSVSDTLLCVDNLPYTIDLLYHSAPLTPPCDYRIELSDAIATAGTVPKWKC